MRFLIGLLFFVPAYSQAFTDKELSHRNSVFEAMAGVFRSAESELPPCEALDRTAGEVIKYEPPLACPLARALFDSVTDRDRRWRASCRDTTHWMEDRLRSSDFCERSTTQIEADNRSLQKFRIGIVDESESETEEKALDAVVKVYDSENPGKGEFARMECALPADLILQFRKKQLSIFERARMLANSAIDETCRDPATLSKSAELYLRYLREGSAVYNEEK